MEETRLCELKIEMSLTPLADPFGNPVGTVWHCNDWLDGGIGDDLLQGGAGMRIAQLFAAQPSAYIVTGTAAGQSLVDTHYWATSFTAGAGNDMILGGGAGDSKSWRWRDGERSVCAGNDATWRRAA